MAKMGSEILLTISEYLEMRRTRNSKGWRWLLLSL